MLTIEDAFFKVGEYAWQKKQALRVSQPEVEQKPLVNCLHEVLAEPVVAPINVPPFNNSAMDGFAVNVACVENTKDAQGHWRLPVAGRVAAGDPVTDLPPGHALQIFTGAPIPRNADAVVIQEHCAFDPVAKTLSSYHAPLLGEHIRVSGQDITEGNTVLECGQRLFAQDLGLCASLGYTHLPVQAPLRVALLNTGNELVEPGQALAPGEIYNSNGVMLQAMIAEMGAQIVSVAQVPDGLEATKVALRLAAAQADLVICTGGVSVGAEDHVKAAVSALGELAFWKIAMKPGKPLVVGTVDEALFMGLPGNPVSAFVTAQLFVPILLRALRGSEPGRPFSFFAHSCFQMTQANTRAQWVRVRYGKEGVHCFNNQSSGVLSSVCWGNAFALIPAETTVVVGDLLEIFPYAQGMTM